MKKTMCIILSLVLPGMAAEDRLTGRQEEPLKQASERFMAKISKEQIPEAMDDLLDRYWYDKADLAKAKALLKSQCDAELSKVKTTLGKPLPDGYEFLGVRRIGKSTIRFVYLQKFQNFFAPWSFTFYKATSEFKLITLCFGDAVQDDLKTFTVTEPAH